MTCDECVSMLATGSLRDLPADSAVMLHCSRCPDCAQLTTLLRDREYTAATVLNNLPPLSNPISVAETAGRLSRRRRVGQLVVMLTAAALVVTIWVAAATTFIPLMTDSQQYSHTVLLTETIPLTCLSPKQAADIINPYLRSHGSTYYVPASGLSAITVRGTASELANSRDVVRQFEKDPSAACRLPPGGDAGKLAGQVAAELAGGGARSGAPQVGAPREVQPGAKK
jgi:hypothetical protein